MKFSIKNFFSKCDQILRKLRIWSHLLKKFLMENFTFCAVSVVLNNQLLGFSLLFSDWLVPTLKLPIFIMALKHIQHFGYWTEHPWLDVCRHLIFHHPLLIFQWLKWFPCLHRLYFVPFHAIYSHLLFLSLTIKHISWSDSH